MATTDPAAPQPALSSSRDRGYDSRRDMERSRDKDKDKDRGRDRDGERRNRDDRSRRYERERARADDYFDQDKRESDKPKGRSRSRSVDKVRDREREDIRVRDKPPRASPEYSEYRRPSSPPPREQDHAAVQPPWRDQENMYRGRAERQHYGGGGADFLESRRQQREKVTVAVWPPSPKAPTRTLSPGLDSKRRKKSSKRRRDDSDSSDVSSDTEEGRRRRERKERKKARKEKSRTTEKERDRERRRRRSRSRSRRYDDYDEDSDRERRRRRSRSKTEDKRRSPTPAKSAEQRPPSTPPEADEQEWVEKPSAPGLLTMVPRSHGAPPVPAAKAAPVPTEEGSDSDEDVGPQPLHKMTSSSRKVDERQYGGALLRGEGSAMAAFLKDGTDVRIPRRGEIGLSSDEIATFEDVGYVMSGSRHRRMNAVRMRKENQVISAEEKRGILKLQQEERNRREEILREEFQQLVHEKLKSQGAPT
ncbi:hypothetical protein A0H81_09154 [Grifola frondosa]|uniref:NF-kappa-B-activating protein C-terminal domain-containing protein n=1 Tax=Grifola frondosa TaxID=5627 RepID=A0A1C7M274_GRIFR|nr:hypothetical protein A0H81_09154 [Grifola frondosa]